MGNIIKPYSLCRLAPFFAASLRVIGWTEGVARATRCLGASTRSSGLLSLTPGMCRTCTRAANLLKERPPVVQQPRCHDNISIELKPPAFQASRTGKAIAPIRYHSLGSTHYNIPSLNHFVLFYIENERGNVYSSGSWKCMHACRR